MRHYSKTALNNGLFQLLILFELGKESYNLNIIVYYIYANYSIYLQLTCIIYLNLSFLSASLQGTHWN